MKLTRFLFPLGLLPALFGGVAAAQESGGVQGRPVAWSPSYGGACAGCDLSGRNMTGWTFSESNYSGAKLDYSLLRGVQAKAVNFETASLAGADLRGANLSEARLKDATLDGARLQGATANGADFDSSSIQGANFTSAMLIGANFRGADLSRSRFDGADVSSANFSGANLTGSAFAGATFSGTVLNGAVLDGTDFTGAQFNDVRFVSVDLRTSRGLESAAFEDSCVSIRSRVPEGLKLPICKLTRTEREIAQR